MNDLVLAKRKEGKTDSEISKETGVPERTIDLWLQEAKQEKGNERNIAPISAQPDGLDLRINKTVFFGFNTMLSTSKNGLANTGV